jgi:hypothetical protein
MHVPLSTGELEALVALARSKVIPITATNDSRVDSGFAIDAEATDAEWALAQLANTRLAVGIRMAEEINRLRDAPVNEPGDRGLTDQEAAHLRTIIRGAWAQSAPGASQADQIAMIAAGVRGWLDTLT